LKVKDVLSDLKSICSNEQLLNDWYEQAKNLANDISVLPEVPRTVSHQQGLENVE